MSAGRSKRFAPAERWYRWSARHYVWIDRLIAAALTLLCAVSTADGSVGALVVSLGMTVPLAWRRSHVVASGGLVAAFAIAHLIVIPEMLQPSAIAVPISLYALAAYGPRWSSHAGLALAVAGAAAAAVLSFDSEFRTWESLAINIALLVVFAVAVWAFGDLRRVRMKEIEGLTERARLLELEREQEAELAAVNERTRIAREMHDIVAHSLTVVIAQADGGRYGAAQDPRAAIAALETISATGRQALTDMRALLSVLRDDEARTFASTPGIDDIPTLVDEMGAGGPDVALAVSGTPRAVSVGAGLTAYRIVQESLTNVLKHAGPGARARVLLDWTGRGLEVSVHDDGRGAAALVESSPGGQGLIGMTERARLHGGTLHAGPAAGGGFRVAARLPYDEA
ncbi:sensor histidine kinase [Rhodococcus triatomae]|nr:sensor histidine kinase [Rhodococcus triatomae]QNG25848.1 sensor histidine kinase [Rhodococcus triatomae]